jgi:anti-sigma B factor antagonist
MKSENLSVAGVCSGPQFAPGLEAEKGSALQLEARYCGEVVILDCHGRIVFRDEAATLSRKIGELLKSSNSLILNLSGVDAIDSGGLGELVLLRMWADANGHSIMLAAPNQHIRNLLELTNLDAVLQVYATEQEAVYASHQHLARLA